jgi:glycosyltransferase involved in cell wall biosynthesis
VWNEEARIAGVIEDLRLHLRHDILVVDDGSTDRTAEIARTLHCTVVSHPRNQGVGAAIRTGIRYAVQGQYDILVPVNGTGKTPASGIPALIAPIVEGRCDFVQGSRYLAGSEPANLPLHRRIGTRLYSAVFSLFLGRRVTDGTSGFRALRVAMLRDPRFRLDQPWLDRYELEPYLYYKSVELGYRVTEVPARIVYPESGRYTRMRILTDWWRIFRPLVYLRCGLRK